MSKLPFIRSQRYSLLYKGPPTFKKQTNKPLKAIKINALLITKTSDLPTIQASTYQLSQLKTEITHYKPQTIQAYDYQLQFKPQYELLAEQIERLDTEFKKVGYICDKKIRLGLNRVCYKDREINKPIKQKSYRRQFHNIYNKLKGLELNNKT